MSKTTPDVFIIESLKFEDEAAGYPEGEFISHILKLAGRKVQYFYIRTRKELEEVVDKFEDSNFRYLHLSCHASQRGISLTLDSLSIDELAEILGPVLNKRRVFLSACKLATENLATALLKDTGCFSVIGPSEVIDVDESALFWASVYHIMFRDEARSMKHKELTECVTQASALFDVKMRYFNHAPGTGSGWREIDINAD